MLLKSLPPPNGGLRWCSELSISRQSCVPASSGKACSTPDRGWYTPPRGPASTPSTCPSSTSKTPTRSTSKHAEASSWDLPGKPPSTRPSSTVSTRSFHPPPKKSTEHDEYSRNLLKAQTDLSSLTAC